MRMYQINCEFCDTTVEAETVEPVKTQAKAHFRDNHNEDIQTKLGDRYEKVSCHNDCGYVIPIGVEETAGLDCPECGHDNLTPLLERYMYWRIESK